MCFGKPLAISTGICYNYFVNCEIINISCRGADGKRTCVVGMETENPSVAELTAKNPKGTALVVPFSPI